MKLKQFMFALVAMLLSFSSDAFAQQTVVVNSFAELKAEIEKQGGMARSNSLRARGVADQGDLSEFYGDIQLGSDIVMSEALEISNLRELTLDLNGHTISGDADKFIRNLGGFTVRDNSSAKNGGISCAIYNGDTQNEGAYLKIEGGTFKNKNADAVVVTNYGVCEVSGGRFFSEGIALVNYESMTIDGGGGSSNNVYIEGKNHYITNEGTLAVNNATIAGAKSDYVGDKSVFGNNVIFYNVAVNGKGYNSLSEAVANAVDGDLIRFFGDITEDAVVTINKAVTLDGNGKKLTSSSTGNAINVNAPGTVTITDITIEGAAAYALEATTAVEVLKSTLSAGGALKVTNNKVFVQNSNLLGTGKMNVISVAEKVTFNFEGGSIKSDAQASDENFFIVGGGCTGATFSIMADEIVLGGADNYLNIDTEANTVKVHSRFETAFNEKGYATDKKGNFMFVQNAVARVIETGKNYTTLAAALDAATDGSTVKLLWADYKDPIAMNGAVFGKNVTITGTAKVDWSKGNLFVGRGGEGNATVTFDGANLTSASDNASTGIHVSGREKNTDNKYDGTLVINNSTIDLDYLINKGEMTLDNATLTVKNGCAIGGRPASETESGQDATATISLTNASKFVVNNHNGMGLGYEAIGVMNIDATSTFETTQSFLVTAKGTMNVAGTANLVALTNNGQVNVAGGTVKVASGKTLANAGTVYVTGNATIDAKVTGAGWFYMNGVNLNAATKLDGAKVAFINGTNNVVRSTIKNGFFSVGVGQNDEAGKVAAFATANALTLGSVVVNVSENATIGVNGDTYSGWVGSAYSADKTQHTYTLNVENSQAAFGYMHVSKDGTLNVDGRTSDGNKYKQGGAVVDFYAGDFIVNGNVTLNNVDAWAKFTKMSVDHVGGILNINDATKFESSIHNGSNMNTSLEFWKAGQVNVAKGATVEVDNGTVLVDGAKLNISGNVTAKGAVTGNGAVTLQDATAVYTAPANLAVVTDLENKMVIYKEGAYKVYDPAAKIDNVFYHKLQEAIDAAVNDDVITFVNDVTENVTVAQTPDVKFTIDGAQKAMTGVITIDGKSMAYETAGVTIQNVKFDATNIATDACIRLGDGTSATRYTNNVTVKDCSFTGGNKEKAAIKSYAGGDKNLTVTGCTVDETMHSLIQAQNITGVVVDKCIVKSKNGINLNSSSNVEITNSTIEVSGYAVRAGVSGGSSGDITLTNNTLKTDNSEGDAVIVIRGTAAEQINLSMSQNVVSGTTHISGTTAKTQVSADANYWDGKAYPTVSGTEVKVNNYYSDAEKTTLVKNHFGGSIVGFVSENGIWGDAWGNAFESYVVKVLDANGNVMGTTTLNDVDNIIDGTVNVTWGINFVGDSNDPYWTWQWTTRPSITKMPAKVQLWIDGAMVNEGPVQFNAPDNVNKIVAATTDADGNLITCQTSLEKAVQAGNTVAILVPGTYNVPANKDLTITGAVEGVKFAINAQNNIYSSITFNNVTFDYADDSHYKGLAHAGTMVYNNCTFNGQVFLYGQSETFNKCTFNQTTNNYNVWTYGANEVAFNECTFNSAGKSVLIYAESASVTNNVAVTKSTFNASQAVAGKAAIEMDSHLTAGINLTIDGETTATGFGTGNVSGNSLWNNKVGDGTNANANNDITVTVNGVRVLQPTYQAQIGETKYKYFVDAVKEVKNGETVTLLEDYVGDVTFTQTKEVSFVLDGNNKTYNGSINITARAGKDATSTLVIKNFNFKTDKTSHSFISSVEKNYYPNNITISNCTFEGTSYANTADYAVVAVNLKSANNIKIENCEGTGLHSFLQNTAGWNLSIDNVKVNSASEGGFALGTVQGVTIKNCDITANRYGIRLDGQYNNNAVFENNKINAFIPVVVRKASVANNLTFNGTNDFTATNTDGYWCVIGTSEYKVNGELPTGTNAATGNVKVVLNGTDLLLSGVYGNFGVASINNVHYLTFAEALDAVKDGETIQILDGAEGDEKSTKNEFTEDINFTITGKAPKYALPVITFQNAEVTIKDAEILIPELDARENAVINIVNSTVHDAGGNSIAKSYYNGTINIDKNSTVYMMQITTMGYINVAGTVNATWQTNVYGNGLINLAQGATFNTAALHLTGQDYSSRDNTDAERLGKPATIVVEGATLNVGKVKSNNGADYSYNSSKGINVGTVDGKLALLDIKNGGAVNFYMANGQTTNFGAGATVNVAASTLKTICRDENGTVTLANNGTVVVTGNSQLDVKNYSGNAIQLNNGNLVDTYFAGRVDAFGTNNISGTSTIGGILGLGYETNPTEQVIVNITGNFTGTNVIVRTNNGVDNILNVGKADGERTTVYLGQLGAFADVNVVNADVTYGYAFIRNDFNATNSTFEIKGGVNTYFAGNAKVVLDNTTWNLPGYAYIGSYGPNYMCGNAEVTLENGSKMTATNLGIERGEGKVVIVTIDETSSLTATNLTNEGEMNIAGTVTASTQIANTDTGTINFTSLEAKLVTPTAGVVIKHAYPENYKIVYKEGAYSFGDFVAEINGTYYETIQSALRALKKGAELKFLNNVIVDEAWDCRSNGALIAVAGVTIDGNGKTLKLTGDVEDKDWNTVFRVAANNATFKNLTIDASEAEKIKRGISAQLSITVDNCKFIGNGTTSMYGVIYGEDAGDAIGSVVATVTNSAFVNNSYGVSDNRNGQDAKSVTLTDNTFTNAKVLLSANDKVTFNNNKVNGASVVITSHNNATGVLVEANGNTLVATQANQITTNPAHVTAQSEFAKAVATNNNVYYLTLPEAIEAVAAGATITMLADVTGAGAVINKNVTIDFNDKTYTFNKAVGSKGTESNGFQILKDNNVTLKNGTLNVDESAKATFYTVIQNYANLTIVDMNLDGKNLDKWSATDGDSYVLSINSGNVSIEGKTNITANNDGDKAFAFDACNKTGYTLPVVTVETTGIIEGLIESTATIIIKKGTFSIDVNPWCAEGLTAEPIDNGYYSIVKGITIIDGQMTEFTNAEDEEVRYIRYERTFKYAEKWQALFLPFEVPVATLNGLGYEVAYLYDVHNKVVAGEEIDPSMIESVHFVKITKGTLRANHPYIIRATKNADLNLVLELKNAMLHSTKAEKMVSVESATTTTRYIFAGTYKKVDRATLTGNDNIPCLAINTGNDIEKHGGWQKMPSGANLAPFRIFMYIINKDGSPVIISDEAAQAIKIRIVGEENEDGITFIDNVENNIQDVNFIYDLQGRRVLEPKKGGLYIINGKKVYYNK